MRSQNSGTKTTKIACLIKIGKSRLLVMLLAPSWCLKICIILTKEPVKSNLNKAIPKIILVRLKHNSRESKKINLMFHSHLLVHNTSLQNWSMTRILRATGVSFPSTSHLPQMSLLRGSAFVTLRRPRRETILYTLSTVKTSKGASRSREDIRNSTCSVKWCLRDSQPSTFHRCLQNVQWVELIKISLKSDASI